MTPARHAEADRVEATYLWALTQLGNAMALDSLELWRQVPATSQAATASWWLARLLRLLFGYRQAAERLAISYYRLVRALRTGYTVAIGDEANGDLTTLEQLRQEFEAEVDFIERETTATENRADGTVPDAAQHHEIGDVPRPEDSALVDIDADIEIEYVADIDDIIERAVGPAEEQAAINLDALGVEGLLKRLENLGPKKTPEDAHRESGNRQAAAAMRLAMNAGRGLVADLSRADTRVVGWIRWSTTGDPCGWCAMLMSREIAYRSAESATVGSDHDLYHDNCKCIAIPIFELVQYEQSDLYALNREFADLWDEHIADKFSGDAALTEWRRLIRERNKRRAEPQGAQEAS